MKKSTLLKNLFWGYQGNMNVNEYEDLRNSVIQHEKNIKSDDASVLAESIQKNYPQFEIMHQSFIRTRIDKISDGVNTIKIIVIIYLVASIIGAIAVLSQMK